MEIPASGLESFNHANRLTRVLGTSLPSIMQSVAKQFQRLSLLKEMKIYEKDCKQYCLNDRRAVRWAQSLIGQSKLRLAAELIYSKSFTDHFTQARIQFTDEDLCAT